MRALPLVSYGVALYVIRQNGTRVSQKNACSRAGSKLFPRTQGVVSVKLRHCIQCAKINAKSIFLLSILRFLWH